MSNDARANMFAQAIEADIASKKIALSSQPTEPSSSTSTPSAPVPSPRPKRGSAKSGEGKFGGREPMNFGIDADLRSALDEFKRSHRGWRNSDVINDALRMFLAPELDALRVVDIDALKDKHVDILKARGDI